MLSVSFLPSAFDLIFMHLTLTCYIYTICTCPFADPRNTQVFKVEEEIETESPATNCKWKKEPGCVCFHVEYSEQNEHFRDKKQAFPRVIHL